MGSIEEGLTPTPALPVFLLLLKVAESSRHRAFPYDNVFSFHNAPIFALTTAAFYLRREAIPEPLI